MTDHDNRDNEELALDALLAATCRTGELDSDMSDVEAEKFAASAPQLSVEDQAAIDALGPSPVTAALERLVIEPAEPLDLAVTGERTYALGIAHDGLEAKPDKAGMDRATQRLEGFLGER